MLMDPHRIELRKVEYYVIPHDIKGVQYCVVPETCVREESGELLTFSVSACPALRILNVDDELFRLSLVDIVIDQGLRAKSQGPRAEVQGQRTKDEGPRTKGQGPSTKNQGSRTKDQVPW
ncbi:hypothetical protein Btru_048348, partial [Bulinus truncatus]